MAARKTTPPPDDTIVEAEVEPVETLAVADEVHERGGWAVGYVGDRVDDADDGTYTVTGVLTAAQAEDDSE